MASGMNKHVIVLMIATSLSLPVSSLESDRDQDIIYSANGNSTSHIEDNKRIIILEENVNVTQGTININGDRAVFALNLETSDIISINITGTLASFRQQIDASGAMVEGESEAINYSVEGEPVVEFVGSATLRRPNEVLTCVSIKYYTESRLTETVGPCEGVSSRPSN